MKKIIVLICLAAPCIAMAQLKYVVKGKIGKLNAPVTIFLTFWYDGVWVKDSVDLKNGVFEFKGKAPFPVGASLQLRRNGPSQKNISEVRNIFLEKGTIIVNSPDSMQHATVQGGPDNKSLDKLHALLQPLRDRTNAFGKAFYQLPVSVRNSPDYQKKSREQHIAFGQERKEIYAQFIRENPGSMAGLELLMFQYGKVPDINEVGPLFRLLSPAVRESKRGIPYGKQLALWERTNIGQQAPVFTQTDTLNHAVSLTDFRGKYVLINFWATWCGPCIEEKGHLRKTYAHYKDKNFEILDVSMTDTSGKFGDREKWQKMVRNFKLPWVSVYGDEAVELYGIVAVPNNFLVDPLGKIIDKDIHKEKLDKLLEILLVTNEKK